MWKYQFHLWLIIQTTKQKYVKFWFLALYDFYFAFFVYSFLWLLAIKILWIWCPCLILVRIWTKEINRNVYKEIKLNFTPKCRVWQININFSIREFVFFLFKFIFHLFFNETLYMKNITTVKKSFLRKKKKN